MRVVITKTYNHRWPNRSMTEWKADPARIRTVKREVGEAAIKGGFARNPTKKELAAHKPEASSSATPPAKAKDTDATESDRAPGRVAGPDSGADATDGDGGDGGVVAGSGGAGAAVSTGG